MSLQPNISNFEGSEWLHIFLNIFSTVQTQTIQLCRWFVSVKMTTHISLRKSAGKKEERGQVQLQSGLFMIWY